MGYTLNGMKFWGWIRPSFPCSALMVFEDSDRKVWPLIPEVALTTKEGK